MPPQMLANLLQMPAWELDSKQESESAVLPNLTRHKSLQILTNISNKYFPLVVEPMIFLFLLQFTFKQAKEAYKTS